MAAKKYLSLEEAAQLIGVRPDEVMRLREKGDLRGFADRGTWKFKSDDVEEAKRRRQPDSNPDVPLMTDDEDSALSEPPRRRGSNSDSDVRLVLDDDLKSQLTGSSGRHGRIQKNFLGWDIYPRGLYAVLLGLKKYRLPVMITENGICTGDDKQRWKFIRDHLKYVHRAMAKGVNVMGYLYWSLLDNFEWDKGFAPRFGLIDVNYKTFKRTVRPSARKYAQVCKTGILR